MELGRTGYGARMTATLEAHDHTWQLQAVDLDDGVSVQEFGCLGCGAVDYR